MKTVAILGAGSWGTALAMVLADNGCDVRIWGNQLEQINEINERHTNERYLKNIQLPKKIVGYHSLKETLNSIDAVVLAIPMQPLREVIQQMIPLLQNPILAIAVSKGIEPDTHKRVTEIIEEEFASTELLRHAVLLSGPSHAEEVALRHPTTVTASAKDMTAAKQVQDLFMNSSYFRVYTHSDLVGAEIGGALKNIIALAAGAMDGLGYGDNAKAALMTRGLAEIARLGVAFGANPLTFLGLTGIGDLIVTCTSVHSRNWRAGNMLGKGKNLDEVLESMGMVVEGVRTTKAAYQLAKELNVKMPITEALHAVLFDGKDAKAAVDTLMARDKTNELEDLASILGGHESGDT